jgi:K+-sensing histidine kinase KdpD
VIFMTSLWEMNDKISAFSVGASDFLTKPFPPEELVARMTVHLELARTKKRLHQEMILREEGFKQLRFLEQELETTARLTAQSLKNKLDTLQPTLEQFAPHQTTLYKEMRTLLQDVEENIENIFSISNTDSWKLEKQRLDMVDIIQPLISKLTAKHRNLRVALPKTWLNSEGYVLWVEKIWDALLNFSIQQAGKNLQLQINNELVDSLVRFSVKNNGAALTKTQITALLSNREHSGIDNELFLVRYLVERCDGEFGIETKGLIGNTFYFTLPASLDFGNTYNRYLNLGL